MKYALVIIALLSGVATAQAPLGTDASRTPPEKPMPLVPERPLRDQPTMDLQPQTLGDGDRVKLAPIIVPQAEKPASNDRRPVYVGLGLLVLAAAFWFNRKRREQFDGSDVKPRRPRRERRDDDADDLHAAARGDDAPDDLDVNDKGDKV